jgi:RHS repeat-associated protein
VDYDPSTTPASDGSINRYYDPATGDFLSVDPMVGVTGQPYSYADDDPVNEDDPTGLSGNPVDVCCSGGGPGDRAQQARECAAAQQAAKQVTSEECANGADCGNGTNPFDNFGRGLNDLSTVLGYVQLAADGVGVGCALTGFLPCVGIAAVVSEASGWAATASVCASGSFGGPASATDACSKSLVIAQYSDGLASGPEATALQDFWDWVANEESASATTVKSACELRGAS